MRNAVVFAAGGTGGHVYPALAIAQEIRRLRPEIEIEFVGRHHSFEQEKVALDRFPFFWISARGWSRSGLHHNVVFPIVLAWSTMRVMVHFLRHRPAAIFATGGYVTASALIAARILSVPMYLQEQNTYPGWVTRAMAISARRIFLAYSEAAKYLPGLTRSRIQVLGMPIRPIPENVDKNEILDRHGLLQDRPVFLVYGGSQGSHTLNNWMRAASQSILNKAGVQIVWQTGLQEWHRNGFARNGTGLKALPYLDPAYDFLSITDLILCRAGASTLAEVAAFGIPSIMVPYPYATDNHQEKNARFFEAKGAGLCFVEKDGSPEKLAQLVIDLFADGPRLETMRRQSRSLGHPDAAPATAQAFLNCLGAA